MRLFVALDIPEVVRARLKEFSERMRKRAPAARWVRVEGIHLTLKFIGEVEEERVEKVRRALEPVRADSPVEVEYRGAGFFPSERNPRVFWAGTEAGPVLMKLAAEIERRLEPLGIARESREFRAHLTLARFERPGDAEPVRRAMAESPAIEFGRSVEREFYLYQSKLGPGGARYTRLAAFRFAPEAA